MAVDIIARGMAGNAKKELDKYKNNPDVADIVQTKADLDNYDTSKLSDNDIVKVLTDETKDNKETYYKWSNSQWDYVGGIGPFYTQEQSDDRYPRQTTSITYSDLVTLKSNNNLVAGSYYRITDYVTTTAKAGTQSANHPFNVIVLALSENELSEDAYASKVENDNYFVNCDLTRWRLKYCLENDTTRFDWADATNGKGVIFRLVDDNLNDLPYDFKNIQFARYKITAVDDTNWSDFEGKYFGFNGALGTTIDSTDYKYYYTFNRIENNEIVEDYDLSIQNTLNASESNERFVKQVTIKEYLNDSPNYRGIKSLNDFVIATGNIVADICFGYGSHHNTIVMTNDFTYSYFSTMFRNNLIWSSEMSHNQARECFESNLILSSDAFNWNEFGDHFKNTYCKRIYNSVFDINCYDNKFMDTVKYTDFGSGCYYNVFTSAISYCRFKRVVYSNIAGVLSNCAAQQLSYFTLENGSSYYSKFGRLNYVTIRNTNLNGCNAIFLDQVTIENDTSSTKNLGFLTIKGMYGTQATPLRIVYGTNLVLPSSPKTLDQVSYTDPETEVATNYLIFSWKEYNGTALTDVRYISSDMGLTWTLADTDLATKTYVDNRVVVNSGATGTEDMSTLTVGGTTYNVGGGHLYEHTIYMKNTTYNKNIQVRVVDNNPTAYTYATFILALANTGNVYEAIIYEGDEGQGFMTFGLYVTANINDSTYSMEQISCTNYMNITSSTISFENSTRVFSNYNTRPTIFTDIITQLL